MGVAQVSTSQTVRSKVLALTVAFAPQEKSILYRRYLTLHIMAIVAVFAVGAAWAIVSATRHSTAVSACLKTFFPDAATDSTEASEGNTMCDIFPWVDVGIMGGLWAFFAAVHVSERMNEFMLSC